MCADEGGFSFQKIADAVGMVSIESDSLIGGNGLLGCLETDHHAIVFFRCDTVKKRKFCIHKYLRFFFFRAEKSVCSVVEMLVAKREKAYRKKICMCK